MYDAENVEVKFSPLRRHLNLAMNNSQIVVPVKGVFAII